ncbi:unnamed protein product, partial [Amoebophrya sp. A120]|eukprot:GSA120T00023306001.1
MKTINQEKVLSNAKFEIVENLNAQLHYNDHLYSFFTEELKQASVGTRWEKKTP